MSRWGSRRQRPWVWIVLGSLVCAGGLIALAAWPAGRAERAAYERAERCVPGTTRDCLQPVPAVVERTRISRRKSDDYYVYLRLEDTARSTQVELPVPDVVFPALTPGREVTALLWDGDVAAIEVPGVGSAETDHSPAVGSLEQLVLGVAAATWGGFGAWNGLALRRGGGRPALTGPGRVLVALVAGSAAGFFLVVSFDVYVLWAYALTTAGVSAAAWLLLRLRAGSRR